MLKFSRPLAAAALAALAIAAITPAAPAQQPKGKQQEDPVRMPQPRRSEDPPVLWTYLSVVLIVGAIFVANMIPSKRGHQD